MNNKDLEKLIEDTEKSIEKHLRGNNHYFYHLALVNKQSTIATIELIKTIKALDKQNSKLEKTNLRLQWVMVLLTFATIVLAIVTLFN